MKWFWLCTLTTGILFSTAAGQPPVSIIPEPVKLDRSQGYFEIGPETVIVADGDVRESAIQIRQMLAPALGFTLSAKSSASTTSNCIELKHRSDLTSLEKEGYRLTVTPQKVVIEAPEDTGLFYGIQTLRQLLPPEIFNQTAVRNIPWRIPCVTIEDYPRFAWRGIHLDVGRHFMPKEFVKKYIDLAALHKMNIFHWHLTEDQGWRIEIKKYPKLTEVGAWRKETVIGRNSGQYDGTPHGGFYTQDDVREIVDYANQRHITVVPEIEMPGHSRAALAAYPELSCTGGPFEVKTTWGVEPEVYCAGNDQVFDFLQDVLDEVLALFPSEYIHIGGDECPKERWKNCLKCQAHIKAEGLKDEHELQSWFIKRMEKYLDAKGRRLIGWDEILEGGLAPNATVMSWRSEEGGIAAARSGHDVVMAPNQYTYLDHYQGPRETEPLAIGGYLPLEQVYSYDPVPAVLSVEQEKHILGAQAQVWTEYIATPDYAEYMAYPRACALAEAVWTPLDEKDYETFYHRLTTHLKRLKEMNVNFRPLDPLPKLVGQWTSGQTAESYRPMTWDLNSHLNGNGTYRVTFRYTTGRHRLDIQSAEILEDGTVIGRDEHWGTTGGRNENNTYTINVPDFSKTAKYVLRAVVRSDGGTDSNGHVYLAKD